MTVRWAEVCIALSALSASFVSFYVLYDNIQSKKHHQHQLLKKKSEIEQGKSKTKFHSLGISMDHLSSQGIFTDMDTKTDLMHRGHTKGGKVVLVMVGLPGRGKSYMARKVNNSRFVMLKLKNDKFN